MKVNIPGAAPNAQSSPRAANAPSAGTGAVATAGFSYVGAVSAPETDEDRTRMRNETQQDIIILETAQLDGAYEY